MEVINCQPVAGAWPSRSRSVENVVRVNRLLFRIAVRVVVANRCHQGGQSFPFRVLLSLCRPGQLAECAGVGVKSCDSGEFPDELPTANRAWSIFWLASAIALCIACCIAGLLAFSAAIAAV